jgi:hypothetical protein
MDVFLIPTSTSDVYELYYEAPDDDLAENVEGSGIIQRVRRRFAEMLREAEDWRRRRDRDEEMPREGLLGRWRRRVMSFIVERIAEQRLLWHLRSATDVCVHVAADVSEERAMEIVRGSLKADADHHFKWLLIDAALLILSAPLMLLPGPNVPGFYFTFQVVGHYLSMTGAKQGLSTVHWTIQPNPALNELRTLLDHSTPHRVRRIQELADRLRLQHFATFFEQVAAPTA